MQWTFPTHQRYLTEFDISEPVELTLIRVNLPRTLSHEKAASFVIERLWGSRRKASAKLEAILFGR
jgi:hypothetical protein